MTLVPVVPGPISPAAPPANRVLPFSRVPVVPGGPLGPIVPRPLPPVPAPIPKPPPGPLGILPVVRPLLRDLADQPGSPIAGAPDAIDLLDPLSPRNPLNPFSPLWNDAPWNQPDTPASLVPPTDLPTGFRPYDFETIPGFSYPARVYYTIRRASGAIVQTSATSFQTGTPLGWAERKYFGTIPGGDGTVYYLLELTHVYRNPSGQVIEVPFVPQILQENNDANGDRVVSYRPTVIYGQPEAEPGPEQRVPAPILPDLFIPTTAPPKTPPIPVIPISPPLPLPQRAPDPQIQPEPEPIPEEDPVPLIPLPIPLPVPSQTNLAPPQTLPPVNPSQPPTPNYNPVPIPGSDPQTQEPRKLPPVPFDFCELECLNQDPPPCDPVVLIRDKSAQSLFSQVINFAGSIAGQYSSVLPVGIASVNVSLSALEGRADTWGATATGEKLGKYGKISLVLDGTPIQDYMLVLQPNITLDIPFNRGGVYSVLVVPAVECIATITEIGERYRFVSVTNSANLPTIDASVLI